MQAQYRIDLYTIGGRWYATLYDDQGVVSAHSNDRLEDLMHLIGRSIASHMRSRG